MRVNHRDTLMSGTCLQGHVDTSYLKLCDIFGEPSDGSGDGKSTVQWVIEFDDGVIATIYDYSTYTPPIDNRDWHIGGHSRAAADHVRAMITDFDNSNVSLESEVTSKYTNETFVISCTGTVRDDDPVTMYLASDNSWTTNMANAKTFSARGGRDLSILQLTTKQV